MKVVMAGQGAFGVGGPCAHDGARHFAHQPVAEFAGFNQLGHGLLVGIPGRWHAELGTPRMREPFGQGGCFDRWHWMGSGVHINLLKSLAAKKRDASARTRQPDRVACHGLPWVCECRAPGLIGPGGSHFWAKCGDRVLHRPILSNSPRALSQMTWAWSRNA